MSAEAESRQLEFWVPFALALALGLFTLGGTFVFDSKHIVRDNPRLESLASLPGLFLDNYWGDFAEGGLYRPITLVSFGLERALFGVEPMGYHATNALLYAIVAGLLALWLRSLGASRLGSVLGGCLFAAHPVHTEPVANLVGRAELLALGGSLGLLLAASSRSSRAPLWGGLAFAVGLFSKESAIATLGVLALLPLFEERSRNASRARAIWDGIRRRQRLWIAIAVVAVGWLALRSAAPGDSEPQEVLALNNVLATRSAFERVPGALETSLLYHSKALVPWPLSADYSLDAIVPGSSFASATALLGLAVLVGLLVLPWSLANRNSRGVATRLIGLGALFYVLPLLVVANILFPTGTIFGERLLFAPTAGLCVGVVGAWTILSRRGRLTSTIATATIGLLVVTGAVLFVIRTADWQTELSIADAIRRVQPLSAKGHEKYGYEQYRLALEATDGAQKSELLAEAARSLERAIEIHSNYGNAYLNLSLVRNKQGDIPRWLAAAEQRYRVDPSYDATLRLARALLAVIRTPHAGDAASKAGRALELSERALRQYEGSVDFLRTKGEALTLLGRGREALTILQALVNRDPSDLALAPLLASAYAQSGEWVPARQQLDRVLEMSPRHPQYDELSRSRASHYHNRALIWEKLGDAQRSQNDRQAIADWVRARVGEYLERSDPEGARRFFEPRRGFLLPRDRQAITEMIDAHRG